MSGTIGIPPWNPETTCWAPVPPSDQPNTLQAVENLLQWEKLLIENDGKVAVTVPHGTDLEPFRRQLISELDAIFQGNQHIPNIQIDTILSILYEDMIFWNGDFSKTIGDTPRTLTETEHKNYEGFFADLKASSENGIATWLYKQRREINITQEIGIIQDLLFKALWNKGIHFGFVPVDSTTLKENWPKFVAQPQESTPWNPGGFMPSKDIFSTATGWLTFMGERHESDTIGRFVRVSTVVGTWIPAEAWIPGRDIFGNIIPVETIAEPTEPTLWNIKRVERDGKILYIAEISGQFMMKWNHIEVRKERIFQDWFHKQIAEHLWPLSGDITVLWGVSAGITTDGVVYVKNTTSEWGNVTNSNINTEASCTIEWSVLGSVHVESTREGIQKGYTGVIEARGDITVGKWIEKAYIWSREGQIEIKWWAIGSVICGENIIITGNVRNCIIVGSDIKIYGNTENCICIGSSVTIPHQEKDNVIGMIRLSNNPLDLAYYIYSKYLQHKIDMIQRGWPSGTENHRKELIDQEQKLLNLYTTLRDRLRLQKKQNNLTEIVFGQVIEILTKLWDSDDIMPYEGIKALAKLQKTEDQNNSQDGTRYEIIVSDISDFLQSFRNPRIIENIHILHSYFQHFSPTNPKPKMLEGVTVIQKSPTHS